MRLAADQVQRANRRLPEGRAEVVVRQRVVLRVVPQCGDGVAVEVVHDRARVASGCGGAGRLDEGVHQAAVVGLLLGRVGVVLVAGQRLRGREADRIDQVGVVEAQEGREAVDRRRPLAIREPPLAPQVGGVRIGPEVMVEGDVLLEDHDEVLNRRDRPRCGANCGGKACEHQRGERRRQPSQGPGHRPDPKPSEPTRGSKPAQPAHHGNPPTPRADPQPAVRCARPRSRRPDQKPATAPLMLIDLTRRARRAWRSTTA